MIRPIPLHDRDKFYQNEYLNTIVDLSLDNLGDDLFFMIIHLIASPNLKYVHKRIKLYKSRSVESHEIYNNIKHCFDKIYCDENKDNLRGAFLELLIYKFLNKRYSSKKGYVSSLHCNVEINGKSDDYKTVDDLAFWVGEGFVSENKIGHVFFEDHDIENLNKIYVDSEKHLKPYIVTFATKSYIDKQLNEIYLNDSTNSWVHGGIIKIISAGDLKTFFS